MLSDMLDTKQSADELVGIVRSIVEIFKNLKLANEQERQALLDLFENLRKDSRLGTVAELQNVFAELQGKITARLVELKDGEPGKDANVELIIAEVVDAIKMPTLEDFSKDLPKYGPQFRDGLELLVGKERLSMKAIDGLLEALEDIKKRIGRSGTQILGGGPGNGSGGRIVKIYDLSASLDGVLKTFSLPAFWRIISVQSSSFPNAFRPTVDYTVDGSAMTITFTSEITAATTLATGQTVTIIYSE